MKYKDLTYNISWTFFFCAYSCIKILSLDIDSFQYFSTFALNQQHPCLLLGNNASVEHHIFPCRRRCVTQRCLCQGFPHACAKISALKRLRFILESLESHRHSAVPPIVTFTYQWHSAYRVEEAELPPSWPNHLVCTWCQCTMAFELFSPPGNIRSAAPGGSGEHKSNVCER